MEEAKATLHQVIDEMDDEMKKRFFATFEQIRAHFGEVFGELFGGGRADLRLTDPTDLLETGIDIVAQPPGKKLQHLSLLSGGERALTAIALLFSILKVRPVPFCVLDEVEAALDEANVQRYAQYLKRFSRDTQFIVITIEKDDGRSRRAVRRHDARIGRLKACFRPFGRFEGARAVIMERRRFGWVFFKNGKEKWTKQADAVTEKFKEGLSKTRNSLAGKVNDLIARYRKVDEAFFEELEEILIAADVGVTTVMELVDELKMEVKRRNIQDPAQMRDVIAEKLVDIYRAGADDKELSALNIQEGGLTVMLFVGVNGVGKTTTIGKLAHKLKSEGKSVLLAAGDTFRAGAIEQLEAWGKRVGVDVIKQAAGSDPAAVMYDAIQAAKARGVDVLLCDTAGRLQNKVNLMKELEKVKRVISREIPGAPHEVLLVLDATTGQNAMSQAKLFKEATDVTGIVLTKLDGTAKGGIVLAIRNEMAIPVKLVGLGEKMDDLQVFDPEQYVYGLFADLLES
ncbi:Signal recognition particle receptor FtsY [Geobacillus sp. BCO2]|nr:Signal recognition particle receptor FtsY [Geobacillus sp. BCO2]